MTGLLAATVAFRVRVPAATLTTVGLVFQVTAVAPVPTGVPLAPRAIRAPLPSSFTPRPPTVSALLPRFRAAVVESSTRAAQRFTVTVPPPCDPRAVLDR